MPKEKSPAIKKKLAKKGLSKLNRECSLDAFKHNVRREFYSGQTAQGTQHVAIGLSVLKRACGVDSKDRMTPKEIVAAGGKRESMNVESINSILVKAIGQIQEQELSSVVEARTKKEQAAIDKATLKKHGVKFRSTDDGGVLAVTKQGDIVSDEPPAKTKGKAKNKTKTQPKAEKPEAVKKKTPEQRAKAVQKIIDAMLPKGIEAEVETIKQGPGTLQMIIGKKGDKNKRDISVIHAPGKLSKEVWIGQNETDTSLRDDNYNWVSTFNLVKKLQKKLNQDPSILGKLK